LSSILCRNSKTNADLNAVWALSAAPAWPPSTDDSAVIAQRRAAAVEAAARIIATRHKPGK
jgi:hypothetical protein